MTRIKKSPSAFDSAVDAYVAEKMVQRGGAFTGDDLSEFVKQCARKFLESSLQGELDYHLKNNVLEMKSYSETDQEQKANKRNGTTKKTVITDLGEAELQVPRDRDAGFEPIIVPKRERRIKGIDDKIISMYARGMSTR